MFIPSVHATFYRNGKHSFKVILEITILLIKEQLYFLFDGTGTRPEKVLTKNIRRVRDFENRILCLRTMATIVFFCDNFFSDLIFF